MCNKCIYGHSHNAKPEPHTIKAHNTSHVCTVQSTQHQPIWCTHSVSVIVYNICMCMRSKHWEHDGKVKLQGPWLCTLYLSMCCILVLTLAYDSTAYGVSICNIYAYEKLNKTDPVLLGNIVLNIYVNSIQPYPPHLHSFSGKNHNRLYKTGKYDSLGGFLNIPVQRCQSILMQVHIFLFTYR